MAMLAVAHRKTHWRRGFGVEKSFLAHLRPDDLVKQNRTGMRNGPARPSLAHHVAVSD